MNTILLIFLAFNVQLPSEATYESIQTTLPSEQTYREIQQYQNNDIYVDRVEQYFEESRYWENNYWKESWSNFCMWITSMFNHLPNYDFFYKYMSDSYFVKFFDRLNNDKSNVKERERFYNELHTTIGSSVPNPDSPSNNTPPATGEDPIGDGWWCMIPAVLIYTFIRKKKYITQIKTS